MSLESLKAALDALDEPSTCEGTVRSRDAMAIILPDGDLVAVDDPIFVDWLLAHGEPAPFGHNHETKLDPAVRHGTRLVTRGEARISGFDPAELLGEIEAVLSPRTHLAATLTDVLVYPPGGHFATHKDTPHSTDLIGTLIVGLPIEHRGGTFVVDDRVFDWSGAVEPDTLRWVALFGDADHEVKAVEAGARVTLVYALWQTSRVRNDPARSRRVDALRAALRTLELTSQPLMLPCVRQVIALDGDQPQDLDILRGVDRDVADVLESAGFRVVVRTCVAAHDLEAATDYGEPEWSFARLARPLLAPDIEAMLDCITFTAPSGDGGGYFEDDTTNLEPFLVGTVPIENWIFRHAAAMTFVRAIDFANDGFVGNGATSSYIYKLAALEVSAR
jgi:2OG-Fe(II) oxygenase superfamily